MNDWTKHDKGKLAPAALMANVRWVGPKGSPGIPVIVDTMRADDCPWRSDIRYHQPTDPEGIPYCSADGLQSWAEYVATDSDGLVWQFETRPWAECDLWVSDLGAKEYFSPPTHRHPGDWRESLYRVWRDE